MRVVVHVDGGSRGNPGPAAGAAVLSTPEGELLDEASTLLGVASNNVAEYRGLLLGLERAHALGATEVEVVNDSELVSKQLTGVYKVKHPDMRPLHAQALAALPQGLQPGLALGDVGVERDRLAADDKRGKGAGGGRGCGGRADR